MEIRESSVQVTQEIKIGDLFKSTVNRNYYILMELEDKFSLRNINGRGIYGAHISLAEFQKFIKCDMKDGKLIHFPSDLFHLTVKAHITANQGES